MGKEDYIVKSNTPREKEGFPDFCWMDIGVRKLERAVQAKEKYKFCCIIGGEEFNYICDAGELQSRIREKNVKLNTKTHRYTLFIEYPTGILYTRLTNISKDECVICKLEPVASEKEKEVKGTCSTKEAAVSLKDVVSELKCNHFLPLLIARTALWAKKEDHLECKPKDGRDIYAKSPHVRRKRVGEKRGEYTDVEGNEVYREKGKKYYLDDNSYPNAQMKAALKRQGIIPKGYETCHIWEETCYDPRYHTCFANLVLLPRAIASLSDHDDNIRDILKYRAYKLFDFWPDEYNPPPVEEPKNYPSEWHEK